MAFTTLMLFQLFNAFNARSAVHSAFRGVFENRWLWAGVSLSVALHALVVYVPFLQVAFATVALTAWDWARCAAVASSVLWVAEAAKLLLRFMHGRNLPTEQEKMMPTQAAPAGLNQPVEQPLQRASTTHAPKVD